MDIKTYNKHSEENNFAKDANFNLVRCNDQNIIVEVNEALCELLEYKKDQLLGQNASILYMSQEYYNEVVQEMSDSGRFNGKVVNVKSNGERVDCKLSCNLTYNSNNELTGSVGVSRPFDEYDLLIEQYDYIISNASDIVYITDLEGNFKFVNDTVDRLLGYKAEELHGVNFTSLIHHEDTERVGLTYLNFLKSDELESYAEFKVKKVDGTCLWVGQQVKKVFTNDKLTGFYAIVRDMNERKKNEEKIALSESLYRELFENTTDLIHSVDLRGNFIYVNNAWLNKLAYSQNEIDELSLFDLISEESMSHCQTLFQSILGEGKAPEGSVIYSVKSKTGEQIVLEGKVALKLNEAGELESIQSFLRDVTFEKRANDKIKEQNQEINQSLDYAKGIQTAMLPEPKNVDAILNEVSIFYQPKEVISGDFYDVNTVLTRDGYELPYAYVADCTGHGIPGGMLSMLCNSLIKEAFKHKAVTSPAGILDFVTEKLVDFFKNADEEQRKDGMDISILIFDQDSDHFYVAAANQIVLIARDNQIIELKGDKQSVGYSQDILPFTNHKVRIEKGDRVVMYTDGYVDQFGGPENKKYMRKKLYGFILDNNHMNAADFQDKLSTNFNEWKHQTEQTDDVTIFSIKF